MKKIFISLILILFLVPFGAPAYSQGQIQALSENQALYIEAHDDFMNKKYSSSIKKLDKLIETDTESCAPLVLLGLNYMAQGNYEQAQKKFSEAIKREPAHWLPYTAMASLFQKQGLTPIAVMYYDKALSLKSMPKDQKPYFKKARQEAVEAQKEREGTAAYTNVKNPGFTLNIDPESWYNAYFVGDNNHWMFEYGYNGESVVDYTWKKLITVHFFNKYTYNFNPEFVYNFQKQELIKQAEILNSPYKITKLESNPNNVYYMWSIPNFKESEIARIYSGPKGIYHIRYTAKKKFFNPIELEEILNILRSFKPSR